MGDEMSVKSDLLTVRLAELIRQQSELLAQICSDEEIAQSPEPLAVAKDLVLKMQAEIMEIVEQIERPRQSA